MTRRHNLDARVLLATGEWEVTACGLVRTPHRAYTKDHVCNAVDPKQVSRATKWLQTVAVPCKRPRVGSYSLKHAAEQWAGDYISNGALIQAALDIGLPVTPAQDEINAVIPVAAPKARRAGSLSWRLSSARIDT